MKQKNNTVNVIGAGLAGCEACYQLLKRGINVNLYEMKPVKFSPAHKNPNFAELVCSNSLKSNLLSTAGGMLKEELRTLDSLVIKCADITKVPAGGALAVDRNKFSELITNELKKFENLKIINEEVKKIDVNIPTIVATGPLTSDDLFSNLKEILGEEYLYFFDAIAPIVAYDSIDFNYAFVGDRYGKGTGDYINCVMNKEEYLTFYNELINAQTAELHDFENDKVFEACMPVEVLAKRGEDALRFGPLKPVGLTNPNSNEKPYAVVQLRRETVMNDYFNMVGFQTHLTWAEQRRVFSLIPALRNAEFIKYGVMHRNTYINAPKLLNEYYQLKSIPNIFFAGQITGVEGYIESISSGLMAGINLYNYINQKPLLCFGNKTMIGALANYIANASIKGFQPMSSNMGIVEPLDVRIKDKTERYLKIAERSLNIIKQEIKGENYERV